MSHVDIWKKSVRGQGTASARAAVEAGQGAQGTVRRLEGGQRRAVE